jgi:hypothetical protein
VRLEVAVVPDAAGISMARHVVDDLSRRVLSDQDLGWRLAMATHELLDNARKYGVGTTAELSLEITPAGAGQVANVRVRTQASPEQMAVLRGALEAVQGASDAWGFYLEAMHRTAARDVGSGLGLARIRAEGEMTLTATFEDDYVSIRAELQVEGEPGGHP